MDFHRPGLHDLLVRDLLPRDFLLLLLDRLLHGKQVDILEDGQDLHQLVPIQMIAESEVHEEGSLRDQRGEKEVHQQRQGAS